MSSLFSCSVIVFASGLQLVAFQVSHPTDPSPDISVTSPSADDPSPLQNGIALATTIQFPHCISGDNHGGGICHIADAGPPIQIAVPIQRVRVGVTYTLIKLDGAQVPSIPPADGAPQAGPGTYPSGETGYTVGIQQGTVPHII